MAPRRPRDIGTAAESAVVRYLRAHGFPHAERRALRGARDAGDITGTPGIVWEVKAGAQVISPSDRQIDEWLKETDDERRNVDADYGILVLRRRGASNPADWWVWMYLLHLVSLVGDYDRKAPGYYVPVRLHLGRAVMLLRHAGYGTEVAT